MDEFGGQVCDLSHQVLCSEASKTLKPWTKYSKSSSHTDIPRSREMIKKYGKVPQLTGVDSSEGPRSAIIPCMFPCSLPHLYTRLPDWDDFLHRTVGWTLLQPLNNTIAHASGSGVLLYSFQG